MRAAWAVALALALLVAAVPSTGVAAPAVRGGVGGFGTAVTFAVYADGVALEGGAAEWTLVCAECLVRISVSESSFLLAQDGEVRSLVPGAYEVREFRGLLSHTRTAEGFSVVLTGSGQVASL